MKRDAIFLLPIAVSVVSGIGTGLLLVVHDFTQQETLAQELLCESPEIPVGTTINETDAFASELLRHIRRAIGYAVVETKLTHKMTEYPCQCSDKNCFAGCNLVPKEVECGSADSCDNIPACGTNCRSEQATPWGECTRYCTQYFCESTGCGGNACPAEVVPTAEAIKRVHESLEDEVDALKSLLHDEHESDSWDFCREQTFKWLQKEGELSAAAKTSLRYIARGSPRLPIKKEETTGTWRDLIMCILEESRIALSSCVTPAQFYSEKEEKEIRFLYSCQEGRLQGLLTKEQAELCIPNNAFCCDLQQ